MTAEHSAYLQLLPEVYRTSVMKHPFLGRYLKIYQKILTGLKTKPVEDLDEEDLTTRALIMLRRGLGEMLATEVIGNLFYARLSFLFPEDRETFVPPIGDPETDPAALKRYLFMQELFGIADTWEPPYTAVTNWLDDLLAWLAGWVDLAMDENWSVDKKRDVLARVMPVFRRRGTREGLQQMIALFLDLHCHRGEVRVCVRRGERATAMIVGETTRLVATYGPEVAVVGGARPWLFLIDVFLDPNHIAEGLETIDRVKALVDREKPEYSYYQIHYHPGMVLGEARLGLTSMLGDPPIQQPTEVAS